MTIRELARATGSSPTAVSLILNNRPHRYAQTTVERVEAAALAAGYVPSVYAQTMRTKRFQSAYVIKGLRTGESAFPPPVEDAFHDALAARGFRTGLARVDDAEFNDPDFLTKARRQWQCDGFAFAYNFPGPSRLRNQAVAKNFPAVWFNQKFRYDSVYPDNRGGGAALAGLLVDLGHRKFTYVHQPRFGDLPLHFSISDREAGARKVIESAGGKLERIELSGMNPHEQLGEFAEMLRRKQKPTAWICYSPRQTAPLISAALLVGLRIPQDLSVVTFGDAREAWASGFCVVHAIEHFDLLGTALGTLLWQKIESPERANSSVKIPMTCSNDWGTVAPPRKVRQGH